MVFLKTPFKTCHLRQNEKQLKLHPIQIAVNSRRNTISVNWTFYQVAVALTPFPHDPWQVASVSKLLFTRLWNYNLVIFFFSGVMHYLKISTIWGFGNFFTQTLIQIFIKCTVLGDFVKNSECQPHPGQFGWTVPRFHLFFKGLQKCLRTEKKCIISKIWPKNCKIMNK